MNVPSPWCRELPRLREFVPGRLVMLGEDWYSAGSHRYRARTPVSRATPFATIQDVARQVGARAEWDKNAGVMRIDGTGWEGMASIGGSPEFVTGEYLDFYASFPTDAAQARSGAKELARTSEAFAPFVLLAEEQGAAFSACVRIEFPGSMPFGYVTLEKDGFQGFLADGLHAWLLQRGFTREGSGNETSWSLGESRPLRVLVWDTSPDALRVDVIGLAEFEARRVVTATATNVQNPPPAQAVFTRALCLEALLYRLLFEQECRGEKPETHTNAERLNKALVEWLEQEGLFDALSPNERRLLLTPVGQWTRQEQSNASWRLEALGVFAWALEAGDNGLPPYDRQFSEAESLDVFPTREPIQAHVAQARLRSVEVLREAREMAEVWYQRAMRAEAFFGLGKGKRRGATKGFEEGVVLFGKPYSALSLKEFSSARSIAVERFRALTWLCDGAPWDAVVSGT